jgi:methylated-DNA-protein-cysteine methyltransferase related protein
VQRAHRRFRRGVARAILSRMPHEPERRTRERSLGTGFQARVHALVRTVPGGAVTTYGDVARALGSARAARQVGYAMAALPDDTDVPWWRVVAAGGRLAQRTAAGRRAQARALGSEGVAVHRDHVVGFDAHRFPFDD